MKRSRSLASLRIDVGREPSKTFWFVPRQVRGDYDNALQTASNGVCSDLVRHTGLRFASGVVELDGFNEIARKRQHEARSSSLYCNGVLGSPLSSSSLHTLADCKSVQLCCNGIRRWNSPRTLGKSLALGGVRHESVYEKKMREIRVVRARQRRMKQAEGTDIAYSTYEEDPSQPPLSQPLLGSLKPVSPEEVGSC